MENSIVKDSLNEALIKVGEQWNKRSKEIQEDLSNKLRSILNNELFDNFKVNIAKHQIEFISKERNGWYTFNIYRRSTWNKGTESYDLDVELNTSSGNGSEKTYLQKLQCLGVLAFEYENQTDKWKSIVGLMDDALYFDKNELNDFSNKSYELRNQIEKLKQDEEKLKQDEVDNQIKSIINKGEIKLKDSVWFYYGSGKYDKVNGINFYFTLNPSGKTYTVEYDHKRRTNSFYDDEGKSQEGVFEIKREHLSNRVKVRDINRLVKDNLKNLAS